jgi:hypothetical protein
MLDHQPLTTSGKRDARIDLFRGIALYMILVDHVAGDPISKFTYQRIGFSDAAELFVFLSGVSCAIVYSRVQARSGWFGLLTAGAKRTAKIYAFYLATSAIVILLISAAASYSSADFTHQAFIVLAADPISALWSAVLLTSPPALPGILVLYLMLTLVVMPLFLFVAQRNIGLALALSGLVWIVAQFDPDLAPRFAEQSYFDWLAWQFLFSSGMFIGLRLGLGSPISPSVHSWLVRLAWIVVIASLSYRVAPIASQKWDLHVEWLRLSEATLVHMKENLSVLRLAHFLSAALLVATYLKSSSTFLRTAPAMLVIQTGRHSLEVFCLSAVCDVLLNIVVVVDQPNVIERVILDFGAVSLILLTAMVMSNRREHHNFKRIASSLDERASQDSNRFRVSA